MHHFRGSHLSNTTCRHVPLLVHFDSSGTSLMLLCAFPLPKDCIQGEPLV